MKKIAAILALGTFVFTGCSVKTGSEMSKNITKQLQKNKAYQKAVSKKSYAPYRKIAKDITGKKIDVSFYEENLYVAMQEIAQMLDINIDESFKPSAIYRITTDFKGTLRDFLSEVYNMTGVKYKYRNGMLRVANKVLISKSEVQKQCQVGEKPTVIISFVDVPAIDVFKYFSLKYGFNFGFNLKFYTFKKENIEFGDPNVKQKVLARKVSLFYTGCDPVEAFYDFLEVIDFHAVKLGKHKFKVQDYITETVDIPTYFKYLFQSGQTMGDEESSSSGSTVSVEEDELDNTKQYIEKFLSADGIINISHRGTITIMDHPSKVKEINRLIQTENAKQVPMKLSISIVRISLNDSLKTAANFNISLSKVLKSMDGTTPPSLALGGDTTGITKGFLLSGKKNNLPQVFNALKELGNTKVVREYNVNTRNGLLNTFRAVERIPYVTTTTTAATSSTQTNVEAKFATSGIVINMLPQLAEGSETVNISTDILISEYLGDKVFNTSQGEITLPRITENEIQVPIQLKMGESMVLTGFNLAEDKSNRSGVPGLIDHSALESNRLFGNVDDDNQAFQLVVIVSLSKIEDF